VICCTVSVSILQNLQDGSPLNRPIFCRCPLTGACPVRIETAIFSWFLPNLSRSSAFFLHGLSMKSKYKHSTDTFSQCQHNGIPYCLLFIFKYWLQYVLCLLTESITVLLQNTTGWLLSKKSRNMLIQNTVYIILPPDNEMWCWRRMEKISWTDHYLELRSSRLLDAWW
jgi:hypothetical protein